LKADRLSEQVDYQSVSRIAGSLALNEEMVQYKGDTFEKFFINAYLAMNFLALGDFDSALVEARRINQKYLKFRAEEAKSFQQKVLVKLTKIKNLLICKDANFLKKRFIKLCLQKKV
jgi:hypothetical protein